MNSPWPPALVSLDESLTLPSETLGRLDAAVLIDLPEVIEQLNRAVESARRVRELVSSELPDATWQNRAELDAHIETIRQIVEVRTLEERRVHLLALATELERGSIVHRRALRVTELNQLRDQAINDLRSQAAVGGTPGPLPGPEPSQWVDWACALKEPEDSESLQTLRNGFAPLDDFIANLEPGMWVVPDPAEQSRAEQEALLEEERQRNSRARLLALATELEHGSIVHHRAFRVSQMNQLRDQAIEELRSQAGGTDAPQTLPGPEADQWIKWACGLKEPEDAESLQTLRDGFAHLDDFIASLEPDMWKAAGSHTPSPETPLPAVVEPKPTDAPQPEPSRMEASGFEETLVSSGPIPIKLKARKSNKWRRVPQMSPSLETSQTVLEPETIATNDVVVAPPEEEVLPEPVQEPVRPISTVRPKDPVPVRRFDHRLDPPTVRTEAFRETNPTPAFAGLPYEPAAAAEVMRDTPRETPAFISNIRTQAEEVWKGNQRLVIAVAAILVLAVLGAVLWRSHRNRVSANSVSAAESKAPDLTQAAKPLDQPVVATDPKLTADKSKTNQPATPAKPGAPGTETQPASKPDTTVLQPMTVAKNTPRTVQPTTDAGAVEAPPLTGLQGKVPSTVISSIPTAQPQLAPKITVSSGVAQGLLMHQVTPRYPAAAKQAHVQGTVILQALIGKDGTVRNLHALSGPPLLTQAAVDAVKQWHYKPYYLDGQPVEAETQISVKFTP